MPEAPALFFLLHLQRDTQRDDGPGCQFGQSLDLVLGRCGFFPLGLGLDIPSDRSGTVSQPLPYSSTFRWVFLDCYRNDTPVFTGFFFVFRRLLPLIFQHSSRAATSPSIRLIS